MVLQEEQHQTYGSSGSVPGWGGVTAVVFSSAAAAAASAGGEVGETRPNKKPKQKTTPQRGLGVAQLEKIRLEEQQKGAATTSASSLPSSFSPVMPLPPLPLSSTPISGASDLNPATRPSITIPSAPFSDLLVPVPPPAVDGSMVEAPPSLAGHGFLPLLWNPLEIGPHGYDVEASNKMLSFPIPLQDDSSNPIWKPPGLVQRHQQQPKKLLPNSSMNPSLSPSFSGVKLRMEPPSNQTNMSNSGNPLCPGGEKMAGMKRPWPFHLDTVPAYTSFPCKLPLPPSTFPRADQFPPMNGHDLLEFIPGSTNLREGPPRSCTPQIDWRSLYGHLPDKKSKERSDAPVHGDPLTWWSSLSPPELAAPPPKSKQPTGGTDDKITRPGGSSQNPDQVPFYSFLPMRSSSQETSLKEQRHETVGSLDLNLKL